MKGSAPGTVSSVSPGRELGALATNAGASVTAEGGRTDRNDAGEAVQVHPGDD